MGFTCRNVTLPTGNDCPRDITTPNSEPALATAYSGAFSQKYLSVFKASLHSCISSKITSVLCGVMVLPCTSERFCTIRWTSFRSEEHTSDLQSLMRISYAV